MSSSVVSLTAVVWCALVAALLVPALAQHDDNCDEISWGNTKQGKQKTKTLELLVLRKNEVVLFPTIEKCVVTGGKARACSSSKPQLSFPDGKRHDAVVIVPPRDSPPKPVKVTLTSYCLGLSPLV